jgi:subfamily B ATP-binding cassette protein MsbA
MSASKPQPHLRYLGAFFKHYPQAVALNIVFNILTVLFGIFSMTSVVPFLQILFGLEKPVTEAPEGNWWNIREALGLLDYQLSNLINSYGRDQALVIVCLGVVVIFFFKNLFRYLAMVAITPARSGIVRDLRRGLFQKLLQLPLGYFNAERKGDLTARISTDVQEVEWSILNTIETISREPLAILGSLAMMLAISPKLVLFAVLMIAITALLIGGVGKKLKKQSATAQALMGQLMSQVDETIGGMRVVKAFNAQAYQEKRFQQENEAYRQLNNRILWRRDLASPLSEFLGISVMALLLWFGAKIVFSGGLDADKFILFLLMFYNIIAPAKSFSTAAYNIRKGMGAAKRIEEVIDTINPVQDTAGANNIEGLHTAVSFEQVHFAYRADQTVLQDVSFNIPKGHTVALVGASGAGKSTLADLLPRFYDVTQGHIRIDGQDIRDIQLQALRGLMGIVTQEPILFHDTVIDNIRFGLDASEEAVIAAAKTANAHDFIMALPEGYHTDIGERGNKLSGGQRQRLTIARAVLRNPPILILDEATSALDAESERLVQEALQRVMSNRTVLVIAHRLSTIQQANQIIVLEAGQIIEQGNHQSLLEQQGHYWKMIQLQAGV